MPYLVPFFIEEIILKITFVNFELLNSLDISASVIPKLNDMSGHWWKVIKKMEYKLRNT